MVTTPDVLCVAGSGRVIEPQPDRLPMCIKGRLAVRFQRQSPRCAGKVDWRRAGHIPGIQADHRQKKDCHRLDGSDTRAPHCGRSLWAGGITQRGRLARLLPAYSDKPWPDALKERPIDAFGRTLWQAALQGAVAIEDLSTMGLGPRTAALRREGVSDRERAGSRFRSRHTNQDAGPGGRSGGRDPVASGNPIARGRRRTALRSAGGGAA